MSPSSAKTAMKTSARRYRQGFPRRAHCGFLLALFTALGGSILAQEGRSFTDLLIAERETTFLLFNRGDGTFVLQDYQLDDADGVAVGDFDRDGDVDFAVLTGLLLGHGDFSFDLFTFAWEDVLLCRGADNFLEFADMDADGLMDVVLGCLDTVVIYYGTGDEKVLERGTVLLSGASYRETKEGPTILAVGDMNEDGLPDLKAGQTAFGTQFFLNQGGRSFRPFSSELPPSHALRALNNYERWVDFNGDGHIDIVSVPSLEAKLGIYLGDGKLGFEERSFEYRKSLGGGIVQLEVTDIDGDGALDVVYLHRALSEELPAALTFFFGRGDGTIREVRQIRDFPYEIEVPEPPGRAGVHFLDLATGDFNGDGTVDIALVNGRNGNCDGLCLAASVLWILDGTGGGSFAAPRIYPGPSGALRIATLGNVDRQFVRGDASDDQKLNITDALVILGALFRGTNVNCGQALDANDDARIDISDAVYVLQYLFSTGPPPPPPYPEPGIDTTDPFFDDGLGTTYPGCSPEWWKVFRERQAKGARAR